VKQCYICGEWATGYCLIVESPDDNGIKVPCCKNCRADLEANNDYNYQSDKE
jgi:hypothetical protein